MTDLGDDAAGLEAEHLARSLAAARVSVPAGAPGECQECGEPMPRLVGGRCGFCRDGPTPPASFYDRPAPVACLSAPHKEQPMQPPNRKITIEGAALAAVEQRADQDDVSFKEAADKLILAGTAQPRPVALPGGVLSVADTDELLDELRARFDLAAAQGDLSRDLEEMAARAIAAEAKLAALKAMIG